MTISLRGVSNAAGQALGSAAASTVSVTPTLPAGAASGDRIFIIQCCAGTPGGTPASWTALGTFTIGSGTAAAGSGLRRIAVYYRDYNGVWTMPAVTETSVANNSNWVGAIAITPTATYTWKTPTISTVGGAFNTATTSYTDTSAASFTTHSGGFLISATCLNDNVTSSAPAITQTGATIGTVTERCDGGTSTGFVVAGQIHTAPVTTGATATITQTQTLSAASQGETVFIEQTELAPAAKTSTFNDGFDTGSVPNASVWTDLGTTATTVSGGNAVIPTGSGGDNYILTINYYDLVASSLVFKLSGLPSAPSGVVTLGMYDSLTDYGPAFRCVPGTWQTNLGTSLGTYSQATHPYLRISESAGTITFAKSADGASWTTMATEATSSYAAGVNPTTAQIILEVNAATSGSLLVDAINPSGTAWTGDASLTVTATPSGTGIRTANGDASLAITASPTAAGVRTFSAAAALTVTATPAAAGLRATFADTALALTATPTAAGLRATFGDTTLAVTDTASANGAKTVFGAAALPVTATPTGTGVNSTATGAALSGLATPTATGNFSTNAAASLTVTATPTSSGVRGAVTGAALTVTDSPAAAGIYATTGAAALPVTATSTASSANVGDPALIVSATASATGSVSATAGANLSVTSTQAATGINSTTSGATLTATATPSGSGVRGAVTGASLPVTATPTSAGARGGNTGAALVVTTTITATGVRTVTGDASLVANATGTGGALRTTNGAASLTVTANRTVGALIPIVGAAALTVTANRVATGTLSHVTAKTGWFYLPE